MQRSALLAWICILPLGLAQANDHIIRNSENDIPLQLGFLFVHYFEQDLAELETHATWVSEHDLAVALHLTARADVPLEEILRWRREGSSWDAVTRRCQLGCEAFYVELPPEIELAAPYARPYATWHARPSSDQRLTDEEIRELVVLRAMSDYCKLPPEIVVALRTAGQSPRAIVAVHQPPPEIEFTAPPLPEIAPVEDADVEPDDGTTGEK